MMEVDSFDCCDYSCWWCFHSWRRTDQIEMFYPFESVCLSNMIWLYISRSLFYYFIDDYFSRTLYAAFRLLVNTCSKNMSCFRIFSGSRKKKEDWPKMVQCSGHNYSATRSSHWTFTKKNGFLRPATLSKKKFQHRCFSLSFTKSLRAPFLQNTSWRLLLHEDTRKKQCS